MVVLYAGIVLLNVTRFSMLYLYDDEAGIKERLPTYYYDARRLNRNLGWLSLFRLACVLLPLLHSPFCFRCRGYVRLRVESSDSGDKGLLGLGEVGWG